jgi:beta-galactosidase GanA
MIKDFVKYHKELLVQDPTAANIDVQYREIYQQACYPEFNIDTFQVGKPFGSLVWKSDAWITQYNPKYQESWKWVTDQYYNSIDQKYIRKINGMTTGLKTYESPYYLIEDNVNAGIDNISWLKGVFHP